MSSATELLKGVCHVSAGKPARHGHALARYGGDELSVILPQMGAEEAMAVGERLRLAASSARFPGSDVFPKKHLTLSIGGSSFPRDAVSAADLIFKADEALYAAKSSGTRHDSLASRPTRSNARSDLTRSS